MLGTGRFQTQQLDMLLEFLDPLWMKLPWELLKILVGQVVVFLWLIESIGKVALMACRYLAGKVEVASCRNFAGKN